MQYATCKQILSKSLASELIIRKNKLDQSVAYLVGVRLLQKRGIVLVSRFRTNFLLNFRISEDLVDLWELADTTGAHVSLCRSLSRFLSNQSVVNDLGRFDFAQRSRRLKQTQLFSNESLFCIKLLVSYCCELKTK